MPAGYGFRLPKKADVVVQVHYHRNGRVERDRLKIGFYFAKKTEGMKAYKTGMIAGRFFAIPANDANFKVVGSTTVKYDCVLHSIMPHMHLLGRRIKVHAEAARGEERNAAGDRLLGLQLAGDVLPQDSDSPQGGVCVVSRGVSTITAKTIPITRAVRRGWSRSANRRPTKCALSFWAQRPTARAAAPSPAHLATASAAATANVNGLARLRRTRHPKNHRHPLPRVSPSRRIDRAAAPRFGIAFQSSRLGTPVAKLSFAALFYRCRNRSGASGNCVPKRELGNEAKKLAEASAGPPSEASAPPLETVGRHSLRELVPPYKTGNDPSHPPRPLNGPFACGTGGGRGPPR